MMKEKTKKKITGLDDERGILYSKLKRSSTSRNMKPLEVWTCQRAKNLKKKSSKIPKNNYAAKMVSAARRQIIGGGGGGAPINKSRRRRRSQIVGGGGAARPAHSSTYACILCGVLVRGLRLHRALHRCILQGTAPRPWFGFPALPVLQCGILLFFLGLGFLPFPLLLTSDTGLHLHSLYLWVCRKSNFYKC